MVAGATVVGHCVLLTAGVFLARIKYAAPPIAWDGHASPAGDSMSTTDRATAEYAFLKQDFNITHNMEILGGDSKRDVCKERSLYRF